MVLDRGRGGPAAPLTKVPAVPLPQLRAVHPRLLVPMVGDRDHADDCRQEKRDDQRNLPTHVSLHREKNAHFARIDTIRGVDKIDISLLASNQAERKRIGGPGRRANGTDARPPLS